MIAQGLRLIAIVCHKQSCHSAAQGPHRNRSIHKHTHSVQGLHQPTRVGKKGSSCQKVTALLLPCNAASGFEDKAIVNKRGHVPGSLKTHKTRAHTQDHARQNEQLWNRGSCAPGQDSAAPWTCCGFLGIACRIRQFVYESHDS